MSDPTLSSYDRFAAAYADLYYETRGLDAEMDRLLHHLPPRPVILDAGCGPGHLSRYLIRRGAFAAGVDLSFPMLAEGRRRDPSVPLLQGDLLALPFEDGTFDGVWARASLIHFNEEDHRRALSEAHRVLKPGGVLYAAVRQGAGGERRREEQRGVSLDRHFQFWREEAWHQEIGRAGFGLLEHGIEEGNPEDWLWVYARKSNAE